MNHKPSLLSVINGKVEYKRERWSNFQVVRSTVELWPGDSIRVSSGGEARVRCANGAIMRVSEGPWGLNNFCQPVPANNSSLTGPPRGDGNDLTIPFVISPRSTLLLNDKPTLRWNAVSGANRYIVSVKDERVGKGEIWKTEVSEIEVVYPGTPTLEPGVDYLVIVKTDNGKSSEQDKAVELRFKLIDKNESQRVVADIEQIKQELSGEAVDLAVAHLYMLSDLKAEAIEMLEALVAKGNQTAVIYRLLGDLYWQVKLNLLSEASYKKALNLAETTQDIEVKAVAQNGLAEIYAARGRWNEAIHWGTAAKADYETLGDTQEVSGLTQKLEEWSEEL